ncbi:uncharacterized protein LOC118425675 [Branchiostoma floridae]|uniref:Uncharacterized protein LOC118425675 n=2 Tax=Branchiostoma floridae TaxID=7739 RepID=A0A9J7LZK4_BRAFL|nr:uncharacterized protein LOC118425675 [Branchiostoma floridae]
MAAESSGDEMDQHCHQLQSRCRLCGSDNNTQKTCSTSYRAEFLNLFGIDLSADISNVHPQSVCHNCRCTFDRYKNHPNKELYCPTVKPYTFKQHSDSCTICYGQTTGDHSYHTKQKRGRKRKKTRPAGPGRGKKKEKGRDMEGTALNASQTSTQTNTTVQTCQAEMGTVKSGGTSTQENRTVQAEMGTVNSGGTCTQENRTVQAEMGTVNSGGTCTQENRTVQAEMGTVNSGGTCTQENRTVQAEMGTVNSGGTCTQENRTVQAEMGTVNSGGTCTQENRTVQAEMGTINSGGTCTQENRTVQAEMGTVNSGGTCTQENRTVQAEMGTVNSGGTCTQANRTVQMDMGTQTDESVCGYIIDGNKPNVSDMPLTVLCKVVKAAAQGQRQSILEDSKTISELHKEPQTLSDLDPKTYYSNRNCVCTSFVDGLADKKTSTASKVMTLEQIYHIVSPVLVAPFTFTRNLLCYVATNSKLVVNMLGKISSGGMIDTVKSYLDTIAVNPLPFPNGDCEVAIDNDQKLKKQWSVRAKGKMTCSVVTSVCQVEHGPEMDMQGRDDLSPASWGKYIEEAQKDKNVAARLEASLSPSERTNKVHLAEVRKFLHQRLGKVANEQVLQGDHYEDYVDARVADMEKKKEFKNCAACGLELAKTKRICANPRCLANLKEAEEAAAGKDLFGTMILAPVKRYTYRQKETEVDFVIDNEHTVSVKKDTTVVSREEHEDIPSSHPHIPPPITMSDPVFVNPNSASAMRKVLRHVGKTANIARYHDNSPCTRKWLVVAMDGLPLGITRNIINNTMYCSSCKVSFESLQLFKTHVEETHEGETIPEVREFDWVILRVGKLHLEMNALKAFVDLNWDVWFAALAEEMGFKSEGAQRVAKSCADHHKSMELLQIAIKGTTDELLLPYVREKLKSGEQQSMSADDFLFRWCPKLESKNFMFLQQQINLYALAIRNFHVGTRRNNTEYIQAGVELFSPLFSGRNHPKYQLIDMYDSMERATYPEDLKVFMERTESVTNVNNSLGEGMDAKLEEKNKASKAWHKGAPLAEDWVRVFRNLDVLQKLRARFFEVIGVPESASSEGCNRYNQEPEVDVWRARLRAEEYLSNPYDDQSPHTSITGIPLTEDLIKFEKKARENKMLVFNEVVLKGKPRSDVRQTIVHVTEDEKCKAEDITKQPKKIIIERTKKLLEEFVVEDVQSYYLQKLSLLEPKITNTNKNDFLGLYYEVDKEASEQEKIRCAVQLDVMGDTNLA